MILEICKRRKKSDMTFNTDEAAVIIFIKQYTKVSNNQTCLSHLHIEIYIKTYPELVFVPFGIHM